MPPIKSPIVAVVLVALTCLALANGLSWLRPDDARSAKIAAVLFWTGVVIAFLPAGAVLILKFIERLKRDDDNTQNRRQ